MDTRFSPHNLHHNSLELFKNNDPHLIRLSQYKLISRSHLLSKLPTKEEGIYILTGGRQVGKTTLLKQWMLKLINSGVAAKNVSFLVGEVLDDHHALIRIVQETLEEIEQTDKTQYLIVDEVTYVKDWDKGLKYLADAGILRNTILVISGSDIQLLKQGRVRFPGRRGSASQVDYHLTPLSFRESVLLKQNLTPSSLSTWVENNFKTVHTLWEEYLVHGGFLTAINDFVSSKSIRSSTLMTYSDWIRGDFLKHGKNEHYLRDVLTAIIKRYSSQVTWNALQKDLSIEHHKTIADYISLLESLDAAFVLHALREDKLAPAPKKARKVFFSDPFIRHAVAAWVKHSEDPYQEQIIPLLNSKSEVSSLVEGTITGLYRRKYPTYYLKGSSGEVDIAYVNKNTFWPVEVKWKNRLHSSELNQLKKYDTGVILAKQQNAQAIDGIPVRSLPLQALEL